MKLDKSRVLQIVLMFAGMCILACIIYALTGLNIKQEDFLFCDPTDCKCGCERNEYKNYCNSEYLKDGSLARCNCKWNTSTDKCEGSLAS